MAVDRRVNPDLSDFDLFTDLVKAKAATDPTYDIDRAADRMAAAFGMPVEQCRAYLYEEVHAASRTA